MKQTFRNWLVSGLWMSGLTMGMTVSAVLAQTVETATPVAAAKTPAQKQPRQNHWTISVKKESSALINLTAHEAPLADLAADLAQQLGAPVRLSPVMKNQRVTAELEDASVETTMRALAPQVYLDEAVNLSDATPPQLLAVYLSGVNEAVPARNASLKEQAETVLFIGQIPGEGAEAQPAETPLFVKVENHLLTVRARRQPAAVLIAEIAQQLGVPFELQGDADQSPDQLPDQLPEKLIDLDAQDLRLEDLLRQLAAPVRLMRRTNLTQGETEPLRIILLAHAAH